MNKLFEASQPLVLVLQQTESEGMGSLEALLRDSHIAWHISRLYAGEAVPPATHPYHGIVVLGGAMSVNDTEKFPFLKAQVRLLEQAIRREVPTLGLCLGAQLLAQAGGAKVYQGKTPEMGWFDVTLTDQGKQDPLFKGCPENLMMFQWHKDTFDLPAKSVHLAESPACANQAFRLGTEAYGLQFHPEMTPEMVELWVSLNPAIEGQPILEGTTQHLPTMDQQGKLFLGQFLKRVQTFHRKTISDE